MEDKEYKDTLTKFMEIHEASRDLDHAIKKLERYPREFDLRIKKLTTMKRDLETAAELLKVKLEELRRK